MFHLSPILAMPLTFNPIWMVEVLTEAFAMLWPALYLYCHAGGGHIADFKLLNACMPDIGKPLPLQCFFIGFNSHNTPIINY